MTFHWSDGWFFSRQPDGSVTMEHRVYENDRNELGERMYHYDVKVNIPADEWCSIIASVSAGGEVDYRWYAARDFHNSKGQIAIHQVETEKQ